MSIRLQHMRDAASVLSSFVGLPGEIIVDTTNNRLQMHDGVTPGGHPAARLDDVLAASALTPVAAGAAGSTIGVGTLEELLTLAGAATNSTVQIPSRAIVFAISTRVVTAIGGASSFKVDATTASGGGAGTTAGQFGAGLGTVAGSTNVGVIGPTAWYAPSTVTLTASGGTFSGGQVRIAIQYMLCLPPTA